MANAAFTYIIRQGLITLIYRNNRSQMCKMLAVSSFGNIFQAVYNFIPSGISCVIIQRQAIRLTVMTLRQTLLERRKP